MERLGRLHDAVGIELHLARRAHVASGIEPLEGRSVHPSDHLGDVGAAHRLAGTDGCVRPLVHTDVSGNLEQDLGAATSGPFADPERDAGLLQRSEVVLGRPEPDPETSGERGRRQGLGAQQVHHPHACGMGERAHREEATDPMRVGMIGSCRPLLPRSRGHLSRNHTTTLVGSWDGDPVVNLPPAPQESASP